MAGVLKELGCKGPKTKADCYSRYWNSGTNWCIGANAIRIGCTEKGFPDSFSPFYSGAGHKDEDEGGSWEEEEREDDEHKEDEHKDGECEDD